MELFIFVSGAEKEIQPGFLSYWMRALTTIVMYNLGEGGGKKSTWVFTSSKNR